MGEESGTEATLDIEQVVNEFKAENDVDGLRTLFVNSPDRSRLFCAVISF